MKLLQINSTVNSGSVGRIAEDIGRVAISQGHQSYIAFGRGNRPSQSQLIRIGSQLDVYLHGMKSLLFDRHGFGSRAASMKFVEQIKEINPDVIHLHGLHGYYINIAVLFNFLEKFNKPVLWTFHDCWSFTGHCSYFEHEGCFKWKEQCSKCPKTRFYPKSLWIDNSRVNYVDKKVIFNKISNLHIITPSKWLEKYVKESFLMSHPARTIHNGIDLNVFRVNGNDNVIHGIHSISNKPYIIGVANVWSKRKGFSDFVELRERIDKNINIVIVGLDTETVKKLPAGIIGLQRTESVQELANLYANALCYVNPTYQDNFPTTNIEALACGTPVITYNTGGSPEAVDEQTGRVVEKGDINGLVHAINEVCAINRNLWRTHCRKRAEEHFDKDKQFLEYLKLYEQLLRK